MKTWKKVILILLGVIVLSVAGLLIAFTSEFGMSNHLKTGTKAPEFIAYTIDGDEVTLQNYKGKKVFLAFFRFAGCPICNFRVHELIENYELLESRGIEVVAVFESSSELLKQYTEDADIPFTIISDPDALLYKKYGVNKSIKKVFRAVNDEQIAKNGKEGEELYDGNTYDIDGNIIRTTADILINQQGIIEIAHYGDAIGDHVPISSLN